MFDWERIIDWLEYYSPAIAIIMLPIVLYVLPLIVCKANGWTGLD